MCFHPLIAQMPPEGGRPRFSNFRAGDPFLSLPCGRCIGCRINATKAWAARCVAESQMHPAGSCWFVTTTYAPEFNPVSLRPRDHTLFLKRLRHPFPSLRFFMCGEYGDQPDPVTGFGRPHFHYLLYGVHVPDLVRHGGRGESPLYTSKTFTDTWGMGHVVLGTLTPESAQYVAGYAQKKIYGERAESHYSVSHPRTGEPLRLVPEFSRMSRRPGIGATWFQKYGLTDVFPHDRFPYKGGRFVKTPKYFDGLYSKLCEVDPSLPSLESFKAKRVERALIRAEDFTDARLKVREACAVAKAKFHASRKL